MARRKKQMRLLSSTMLPSKIEVTKTRNPRYIPPVGDHRPVEKLPPEVLAYIFELGMLGEEHEEGWEVEEDDGDEDYEDIDDSEFDDSSIEVLDDDDSTDDMGMPGSYTGCNHRATHVANEAKSLLLLFQVRMSHVCRKWRQIALNNPTLWTTLDFTEPRPFLRSHEWLERSKEAPLDLLIDIRDQEPDEDASVSSDLSLDDGRTEAETNARRDLAMILDLVIPHVARWRTFELNTWTHDQMCYVLARLAQSSNAPLLRSLRLYCDEDFDEMHDDDDDDLPVQYKEQVVLFGGYVENLQQLELSGVHLGWKMLIPPSERDYMQASRVPLHIANLTDIDLSYHSRSVRPSFQDFVNIIRCSPNLTSLKLIGSGPSVFTHDPSTQTLLLPNLRHLALGDFGSSYAISICRLLRAPNLRNLDLDFDEDDDYTSLIDELTPVMPPSQSSGLPPLATISTHCRTELVNLTDLKLAGLPCEERCAHAIYLACRNVRRLQMNMNFLPDSFFSLLMLADAELYSRMERPTDGLYAVKPGGLRYSNQPGPYKVLLRHLESLTVAGLAGEDYVALIKRRKALGAPIIELNVDENDDVSRSDATWLKRNVRTVNFVDFSDEIEEVDFSNDDEYLPWILS